MTTAQPSQLPGAVLAILALANALSDAQATTSYQSKFDTKGAVSVSAVPPDFWKTRWIATSNPFRGGATLEDYITNPAQFQSAFPGTTAFNTLPPLFFGEMGRSQQDAWSALQPPPLPPPAPPPPPPWNPALCDAQCKAAQAAWVLDQITVTNRLASNAANTPQGYFLGSCFFQHSFVDASNYEAWDVVPGSFATRNASPTAPFPAAGKSWRIDVLKPLPVWTSVTQGYASALPDDDDTGPMIDEPAGAVR